MSDPKRIVTARDIRVALYHDERAHMHAEAIALHDLHIALGLAMPRDRPRRAPDPARVSTYRATQYPAFGRFDAPFRPAKYDGR